MGLVFDNDKGINAYLEEIKSLVKLGPGEEEPPPGCQQDKGADNGIQNEAGKKLPAF